MITLDADTMVESNRLFIVLSYRRKPRSQHVTLLLDDSERDVFEQFLRHRRLNHEIVNCLRSIKEEYDLKSTDLRTAESLTYSQLIEELQKAVERGWLPLANLVGILDQSEISGRQHVCVFRLPDHGGGKILESLRAPTGIATESPTLADFLTVPSVSTARIIDDTSTRVSVKIVTRRTYSITTPLDIDPSRDIFERLLRKERSAVVVKCDTNSGILQCRIPPREMGQQETAKAVFKFLSDALSQHYTLDNKSWFHTVQSFPISDAYAKILANKTDFELWYDTPNTKTTKSRISRIGRPKSGSDLRNDDSWKGRDKGYFRDNLRGFWKCDENSSIYVHMNADEIWLNPTTSRKIARLVVPDLCQDWEIDHVIDLIQRHF